MFVSVCVCIIIIIIMYSSTCVCSCVCLCACAWVESSDKKRKSQMVSEDSFTVAAKLNITHRLSGTTVRRIYGFVCRLVWLCIV